MSEDLPIEDARNVALEFECRNPRPGPGENVFVVRAEDALKLQEELSQIRRSLDGADMPVGSEHEKYSLFQRVKSMAEVKNYFLLECYKARDQCEAVKKELEEAREKLARLSRMIEISQKADDEKSEAEIAASVSFREAMAITDGEIIQEELDAWKEDAERLAGELERHKHADGCICEAPFGMCDGSHPRHSPECEKFTQALAAHQKLKGQYK